MATSTTLVPTPLGPLRLVAEDGSLTAARFGSAAPPGAVPDGAHPVLAEARRQLDAYFAGARTEFDLPVRTGGTPFQERVWAVLRAIPHGQTMSYGALAARVGAPKAAQAVGAANGQNPVAVVVPCHRVVGADGALTGYAGGLDRKRALLDLESAQGRLFG